MEELIEHLEERNEATLAWIAEGPDRWATTLITDPQYWIERGIHNLAEFKRDENESFIWDAYKEVCGFRPRDLNLKEMTDEEINKYAEQLSEELNVSIQEEKKQKERAIVRFEKRIDVVLELVSGSTREDALRFIIQSEDMENDISFYGYEVLEFHFELPYGYIKNSLKGN